MTKIKKGVLTAKLKRNNIDISGWGKEGTKSVDHLLKEISTGESRVTETGGIIRNRAIRRSARVACVEVVHRKNGEDLILHEDRQEFGDGGIRKRETGVSVCEKIKRKEDPREAAYRGVAEELGIRGPVYIDDQGVDSEEKDSLSYPGLTTSFCYHRFRVWIDKNQYREEGYQEVQKDKTTYFVWKKLD